MSQAIEAASIGARPRGSANSGAIDPIAIESRYESGVFAKRPLQIVRGEGSHLIANDGTSYLDAGASYGTNHVGHCHPRVVRAIQAQAGHLLHIPSTYGNDTRLRFFEALHELAPEPLARSFLCSTGTEAIEAAIKFARQSTGRTDIVALQRGFHGRTYGALSATAKAAYRKPFEPLVPGFSHTRPDDIEALKEAITPHTAAFLIEPIQGEGGVLPLSTDYLRAARDITADNGTLLIADEVQTGLGRTGAFLAVEHAGITPDLVAIGKGLGGGVPLAACLLTENVATGQATASHGTTFGGNPLACAAGTATLETIRDAHLVARAAELGERLLGAWQPLAALDGVRDVRGRGLMLGIELARKPYGVLDALVQRQVLALPAGATVVRFLPPLNIHRSDVDHLASTVTSVFRETFATAEATA